MRRVLVHGLITVALATSPACSSRPPDPIEELRVELEEAAEARDADRLGERLSEGFRGPREMPRAEALATLRRSLAAYESVALEVYGLEVERDGARAEVRCVVEFAGRARPIGAVAGLLPPAAVYRFQLEVAEEGGVWRVRRATWQPVGPEEADR